MQVISALRDRGVQDILICCVDGLEGFPEAIEAIFPKTTGSQGHHHVLWCRCEDAECAIPMTASWRELAAQKRAGEDRLIERYRIDLFGDDRRRRGRGNPVTETPWGPARQFFPAMYVAGISRRSVWPETQVVLKLFLEFAPDRRVIGMRGIWPPATWDEAEPPYNELFAVNLAESIHKYARSWLAAQQGSVVYFVWSTPVDFEPPPAPGGPPPELMTARAEVERIRKGWASPPGG